MKFSVGICAYNEEKNIGRLLKNILSHKSKHQLVKIIVVSSGSTDRTDAIIKSLQQKNNKIKLIIEAKRKGKWSAVNKILFENKSKFLVMTDADCLLADKAIDFLLAGFSRGIGVVGGKTIPVNKGNGFWSYGARLRYQLFHFGALIGSDRGDHCHLSGYLYAIRKGLVNSIPPLICDDLYIGVQVKKKGFRIIYQPNAQVYIKHPTNLRDFIHQRVNIRLGHLQIKKMTKHRASNTIPLHVIPLLLVSWETLGGGPREFFFTFLIALLEQCAALIAFVKFKLNIVPLVWKYNYSSKQPG